MSVGIPGTGIGGLFYLISGLMMPLREIAFALKGQPRRPKIWRLVLRQTVLVLGVLAGIWTTGWLLGLLFMGPVKTSGPASAAAGGTPHNLWGTAAVLAGIATLALVIAAVEAARFLLKPTKQPSCSAPKRLLDYSRTGDAA